MKKVSLYFLVFCLLSGSLLQGCQKNQQEKTGKPSQKEETKKEIGEDTENAYDMGGLGNFFQDTFEASKFKQEDVDSDTVQWFCTAYALYTAYNGKEPGIVGGILLEDRDVYQRAVKEVLSDGWDITGRKSAVKKLDKLLSTGHRSEYQEFTKAMEERNLFQLSEEEFYSRITKKNVNSNKYMDAFLAYQFHGESALDGWDYCRALQVLGDCYVAGYISLEECLDQSLVIAQKLQSVYDNWDEVCQSYLYGYQYWKEENPRSGVSDTAMRRSVYEELRSMENGPFRIPYDTKLTNTWKDVEVKEPDKTSEDTAQQPVGFYLLTDARKEKTFRFKVPKGYKPSSDKDPYQTSFSKADKAKNGFSTLRYSLTSAEAQDDEAYMEFIQMELALWEKQGGQDFQVSDIQTKKVNDVEVKYVTAIWEKDGYRKQDCWSWTVYDKYLLDCILEEDSDQKDYRFTDILKWLDQVYQNIEEQ